MKITITLDDVESPETAAAFIAHIGAGGQVITVGGGMAPPALWVTHAEIDSVDVCLQLSRERLAYLREDDNGGIRSQWRAAADGYSRFWRDRETRAEGGLPAPHDDGCSADCLDSDHDARSAWDRATDVPQNYNAAGAAVADEWPDYD